MMPTPRIKPNQDLQPIFHLILHKRTSYSTGDLSFGWGVGKGKGDQTSWIRSETRSGWQGDKPAVPIGLLNHSPHGKNVAAN